MDLSNPIDSGQSEAPGPRLSSLADGCPATARLLADHLGGATLLVLAPTQAAIPSTFGTVYADTGRHRDVLSQLQRLRGDIYLKEGAIPVADLDERGRHLAAPDETSWHLLALDDRRHITAFLRLTWFQRAVSYDTLEL